MPEAYRIALIQHNPYRQIHSHGIRGNETVVCQHMDAGLMSLSERLPEGRMGYIIGGKTLNTFHLDDKQDISLITFLMGPYKAL